MREKRKAGSVGPVQQGADQRIEPEMEEGENHKGPRKANDPFAPDDVPVALLEFHSPTLGMVNMPMTASARYITWLVGSLVLASVLAMALFPLNKVVTVTGRIISTAPIVVVQPLSAGRVRSIYASVGQYVRKGQVLVRLDPTLNDVDMDNLSAQMESQQAEVFRLKAQAADVDYHADMNVPASIQQEQVFRQMKTDYQAHVEDFDRRIAGMLNDLQAARGSAAMYASKLRVTQAVLDMREREQKEEVGSRLSTLGAQDALMDTERALIAAQQTVGGTQNRLDALRALRESYIQSWKTKIYGFLVVGQRRLDQLRSDYRKGRVQQKEIDLRAPSDGVVLTVAPISVGAMVAPTLRVVTLEPTASGLEVEALMSPQDSAYVRQGHHAIIKFASFPYVQYGGAKGTVHLISADTFLPPEMVEGNIRAGIDPAAIMKEGNSVLFYRVRLKIDKYTLHGQPSFFHPSAGMPVTADIDVGKRTILNYLFGRAIPAATEGMREPS
ncbi:HlyD family type I secretion periplasmic adaptor subunit [Bombella sp. TMW 2.2559]|uniref:Membrane fusion protein (MFP) family protein n=1 Tax=Bombella dulcis TaxID=2967339 RepID=A0ABT3WGK5_9PROT|nr:HlyD family type I secretion periplasmic adaptor subunit [Bombella dulcis]MCX5616922.1 HlyD family type I secretion periplasmic adaptor subunit [Bombella dulcis]